MNTAAARPQDPIRHFSLHQNVIESLAVGNLTEACNYRELLPQLLAQAGAEAYIYPSENYYYFSFDRAGSSFSGSLRLSSDLRDQGEMDYVCYQSYRSWIEPGDEIRVQKRLSAEDGITIEKIDARQYRVTYSGKETLFTLHTLDHESEGAPLMAKERRVGRTQDDSGAAFELLYNQTLNDFYFLLDEKGSVPDDLLQLAPYTAVSRRTGFVYYHAVNTKRYVLVAVNERETRLNSYFDGPFDHLPENDYGAIGFWGYVYKAYPDMIGNHTPGGTVSDDGMIFSIRPYRLYDQTNMLGFVEICANQHPSETKKIACMIWGQ